MAAPLKLCGRSSTLTSAPRAFIAACCGLTANTAAAQEAATQTAEQVYLASALAIEPDTQAEQSYLQYLAARLNLDPQRAQELHRVA